jgi:hypothetical protein
MPKNKTKIKTKKRKAVQEKEVAYDDDNDDDAGMEGPLGGGVEFWPHQICDAFLRSLPTHLG